MKFDFKFLITIVLTAAGVLLPIWLWQHDLRAKSISVRLLSVVPLKAPDTAGLPNVQLAVDGMNIDSAFLSTLEIVNDGAKPIATVDFESPLVIGVGKASKILKTQITKVDPAKLSPILETNGPNIKIAPLLLNSNDSITIVILTSGAIPQFEPFARIAGVREVFFEKPTHRVSIFRALIYIGSGALGLVFYFVFATAAIIGRESGISRALTLPTAITFGLLGAIASKVGAEYVGVDPDSIPDWAIALVVTFVGFTVFLFAKRRFEQTANRSMPRQ